MAKSPSCQVNTINASVTGLRIAEEECPGQLPTVRDPVAGSNTTAPLTVEATPTGGGGVAVGGVWDYNTDPDALIKLEDPNLTQDDAGLKLPAGAQTLDLETNLTVAITLTVNGPNGSDVDGTPMNGTDQQVVLAVGDQVIAITGPVTIKAATFDKTTIIAPDPGSDGPTWIQLPFTEMEDTFGAEVQYDESAEANDDRMDRDGEAVGVTVTSGWTEELKNDDVFVKRMQGALSSTVREKGDTYPLAIWEKPGSSITATATGLELVTDSEVGIPLLTNHILNLSGFVSASNNGPFVVQSDSAGAVASAGTPQVITLVAPGPAAAATTDARIQVAGFQFPAGDLTLDYTGGVATLNTAAIDFTTLGLNVGECVFIGSDDAAESFDSFTGYARVNAIEANKLTVFPMWANVVSDAGAAKTVRVWFGKFVRNEEFVDQVDRTYAIERTLGKDADGIQSEVLLGNTLNTMTLNQATKTKVTIAFQFLGQDEIPRTGIDGLWPGDRPKRGSVQSINTTNNVFSTRLYRHAGNTSLFSHVDQVELVVNNNAEAIDAIGEEGAFDTALDNCRSTGSGTAFFRNLEAKRSIRNGEVCGFYQIISRSNAALVWDNPRIRLGGGSVQRDRKLKQPITWTASKSELGFVLGLTFFPYVPKVGTRTA